MWPHAGAGTKRGTAREQEEDLYQSCPLGHSHEPTGTRTLQIAPGEAAPQHCPRSHLLPLGCADADCIGHQQRRVGLFEG